MIEISEKHDIMWPDMGSQPQITLRAEGACCEAYNSDTQPPLECYQRQRCHELEYMHHSSLAEAEAGKFGLYWKTWVNFLKKR